MYYLGLDLGQRRDHSALVVVQRIEVRRAYVNPVFDSLWVQYAERIALGTPYPNVVSRVRQLAQHRELVGQCSLAVDATGVGSPVVEMLRSARLGCEIHPVTITGGDRPNNYHSAGGTIWNVPKQDLVSGVSLLLENRQLKISPKMREAGTLMKELRDMRATPTRRNKVKFGADGDGQHDDLACALSLACWIAMQRKNSFGNQRLPGI